MIHGYPSVYQIGHKAIQNLFNGEVVVQEKIDGSQFSFGMIDGQLQARSKGQQIILDAPEGMFQRAVNAIRELDLHPDWVYRAEYLCLSGDTRVKKCSGGRHQKYMTLKTLFELQNQVPTNGYKSKGLRKREPRQDRRKTRWEKEGFPSLYSLDLKSDKIVSNEIQCVIHSGMKSVIRITTRKGFSIKTTAEHLFWTPLGWRPSETLAISDCVGVVDSRYYRVTKHLLGEDTQKVAEMRQSILCGGKCAKCGIEKCLEVHHLDGNHSNNTPDNLQVLCRDCHQNIPKGKPRRVDDYEFDKIVEIENIGIEDCYDVSMNGDENCSSFVAESFIVHNCSPKHNTICYERIPKNHLILFDICTGQESYMPYEQVCAEATRLGLEAVPMFYRGELKTLESFKELLTTESILGKSKIEGVVVKNYAQFTQEKKVAMGKYVSEDFKEENARDFRARNPTGNDITQELIMRYKTEARWRKAVQHLREQGKLEGSPRDIGLLIREIPADILKECEQEIKDTLFTHFWKNVSRGITAGMPEWYKEELLKSAFE